MARKTLREPKTDTELAYAYAKTDRHHDMQDFLAMTNVADILEVREKCFEDELYPAAKVLFISISNWAHLATTLIYLGENQAAGKCAECWKHSVRPFFLKPNWMIFKLNTMTWQKYNARCGR
jgi:clathrin heavy chain